MTWGTDKLACCLYSAIFSHCFTGGHTLCSANHNMAFSHSATYGHQQLVPLLMAFYVVEQSTSFSNCLCSPFPKMGQKTKKANPSDTPKKVVKTKNLR